MMDTFTEEQPALAMKDIVKIFGNTTVVNSVCLVIKSGEVVALLGENASCITENRG